MSKLFHLTAHLLFHIFMCMLSMCAWGSRREVHRKQGKIQVCTCISAIPFSGGASASGHGNTLQQNVTPKSKRDHTQKSRATGRPEKGCQVSETPSQLSISEFSCCPEGASSSALRAPDDLRGSSELWPEAKLQDVAVEFR